MPSVEQFVTPDRFAEESLQLLAQLPDLSGLEHDGPIQGVSPERDLAGAQGPVQVSLLKLNIHQQFVDFVKWEGRDAHVLRRGKSLHEEE
jgi:hypothetical protein